MRAEPTAGDAGGPLRRPGWLSWPGPARATARRVGVPTLVLAGYFVAYLAWHLLSGAAGHERLVISDAANVPVSVAAAVLAVGCARAAEADPRTRRAWWFIAAAMVFQTWGDIAWFWFDAVRGIDAYPSVADIGYLGLYPLLLGGLLLLPRRHRSRREHAMLGLDAATVVLGGFMVIWAFSLGPALHARTGGLEGVISVAYPLGDLLLVLGAATVALRGQSALTRVPMTVMLAGLGTWAIADTAFAYYTAQGSGGGWVDPLWIAALCCFAASADQYRLGLRAAAGGVGVAAATRPVEKPSLLPYLALVAGYVVVGRAALDLPLYPLGGLLLANVLVTATVVMRQMLAVSEHSRLADRYHVAATTDGLTGLLTRRHFLDLAADTMSLCLRAGRPVALLVIDVDRFKHVNDRHGHLAGDAVLAHVAQRCRGVLRDADLLCRFGGDELVALLPGADPEDAFACGERVVGAVRAVPVVVDGRPLHVTVSVEAATRADGSNVSELIEAADGALYSVKQSGRDHVRLSPGVPLPRRAG